MSDPNVMDDTEHFIPEFSPVCSWCAHLYRLEGRTCDAFTKRDSIPLEIWMGEHEHRTPYPGDNGIQFEPIEEER